MNDLTALAREIVADYLVRTFDATHLTPNDEALVEIISDKLTLSRTAGRAEGLEDAAKIVEAPNAGMLPPDGGDPTPQEQCRNIAALIRALASDPAPGEQVAEGESQPISAPMAQSIHGEPLTCDEFCIRFKAEMLRLAQRETFDDGSSIADYADMTGPEYFDNEHEEDGESPEDCAAADVSYWEPS